MSYWLGIDIGTTATAAAVRRADGSVAVVGLGDHGTVTIPSTAFLDVDGSFVFGDAAVRRGVAEPERVARHFKRRIGDPVPIVLGRSPVAAPLLHARLLRSIIEQVAALEGDWPAGVVVAHPANWSTYKLDLVRNAAEQANVTVAGFVAEPVAAAVAYAADRPLHPGAHVAVYDLGGGTFDACVLRARGDGGFDLVGAQVGVDQLGGIDLDEAVLAHVGAHVGGALDALDGGDAVAQAALLALRRECTTAKEGLSSDTEVTIPVLLPTVSTTVRLTRTEFEEAIRPAIDESILALHRAIDGAGLVPAQLDAVLLVGGSSRIPLVGQVVSAAIGRPVVVDAHPKDVVAIGAALVAAGDALGDAPSSAAAVAAPPPPVDGSTPATDVVELADLEQADDGRPRRGRSRYRPLAAVAAAVVLLAAAAAFLLGGRGDDDPSSADGTTTTTDASGDADPTSTTTGSDGTDDGELADGPEDFAAAGITDFGDEAEALWTPSCIAATQDQVAGLGLDDAQIGEVCTCIYERSTDAFDGDFATFLDDWFDEEQITDPLRGIVSSCVLEGGIGG